MFCLRNKKINFNYTVIWRLACGISGFLDPSFGHAHRSLHWSAMWQGVLKSHVLACSNYEVYYSNYILCLLNNFACFFKSADFFFSKWSFTKNSFRNTIRVSNSLDPDQAWHFVGPDLVQKCLQNLSADDTSGQRVNSPRSSGYLGDSSGLGWLCDLWLLPLDATLDPRASSQSTRSR